MPALTRSALSSSCRDKEPARARERWRPGSPASPSLGSDGRRHRRAASFGRFALATLRNPAMMAVVLGLAIMFGLCFAAGQAPPVVIIGSAVLMALALFAAASSGARGSVALDRYARSRGLQFVGGKFPRFLLMPSRPQRLGAYPVRFTTGLIGSIGGGPSGVIAVLFPNVAHYRYNTPSSCLPIACYDFSRVGDKLGTDSFSVWTVDGRIESDRASDHTATPLLDPELAAWLVRSGGVSFEFAGGWLFVTDASCPPRPSSTGLDHLAQAATHVAARVLEVVSTSAAAVDLAAPHDRVQQPRHCWGGRFPSHAPSGGASRSPRLPPRLSCWHSEHSSWSPSWPPGGSAARRRLS